MKTKQKCLKLQLLVVLISIASKPYAVSIFTHNLNSHNSKTTLTLTDLNTLFIFI